MSLHGLNMEDLYEDESSKHRTLILSRLTAESSATTSEKPLSQTKAISSTSAPAIRREYLSVSCPSIGRPPLTTGIPLLSQYQGRGGNDVSFPNISHSLPDVLCTKNLFKTLEERRPCTSRRTRRSDRLEIVEERNRRCPHTPPPSPTPSLPSDPADISTVTPEATLVKIRILSEYQSTISAGSNTRKVNVDINSLLVCVNVRPWVMIVDLLSRPAYGPSRMRMKVDEGPPAQDMSTTVEMSVQNLAMQLNADSYEICEAQVRQLWVRQEMNSQGTNMQGRLGKVLIFDLTPFGGKVYEERFVTPGNEAFQFALRTTANEANFYIIECNIPGSVRIVHTHLFLCEVINFISEFTLAYELLLTNNGPLTEGNPVLLRSEEMPQQNMNNGRQKARVDLRVTADAPLVVVPRNSHHADALVVNLGRVDIRTTFEQTTCLNQVKIQVMSEYFIY